MDNMTYILGAKPDGKPRDYISWSSYQLWTKSKELYRRRYYENIEQPSTAEMLYGKEIGELLENNHESMSHVPRYSSPEHKIDIEIEGVRILAYLDSFDPETCSILEYKSSHLTSAGEVPWNKVKVRKHGQLPWYSLLVKEKYGKVNNKLKLVWLETKVDDEVINYKGHKFVKGKKVQLTGKVEIFERNIFEWERKRLKQEIIKTVKEIAEDYEKYQRKSVRKVITFEEPKKQEILPGNAKEKRTRKKVIHSL